LEDAHLADSGERIALEDMMQTYASDLKVDPQG